MKLLYLALIYLSSSAVLNAQEEPKPPVFTVSFSNNAPKTGDIIEVILKANVPAGLHMYSTYNKCDIGPLKLDIKFVKESGYTLIGEPYSVNDKKIQDDVFKCELGQFEKIAEVRQKIKITGAMVLLNGTIEGQWCNETTCYNFGNLVPVNFSSGLKATPGSKSAGKKSKPAAKKPASKNIRTLNSGVMFLKPADCTLFAFKGNLLSA